MTHPSGSIRPGQIWEDKDQRPAGRQLRVISVHPHVIHSPAYARLVNIETGRESGIQLARLVHNYRLVEDA